VSHPDPRNVCAGCRVSFDRRLRLHTELGPIVHDDIWQQFAADPRECLCFACMDWRVAMLGHVLRRDGGDPSANLAEWRSVGELATPTEGTVMRRPMKPHITPRSDGGLVAR
jgi:hypothetical protein